MSDKPPSIENTQAATVATVTTVSRPLRRIVTVVLAVVATAVVSLATAPSASAQGNCTHYGQAGYAQLFTDNNYQGDCFEYELGWFTPLPDYMKDKVSSLRSWSGSPGSQLYLWAIWEAEFVAAPNAWWPSLPSWINDKADRAG